MNHSDHHECQYYKNHWILDGYHQIKSLQSPAIRKTNHISTKLPSLLMSSELVEAPKTAKSLEYNLITGLSRNMNLPRKTVLEKWLYVVRSAFDHVTQIRHDPFVPRYTMIRPIQTYADTSYLSQTIWRIDSIADYWTTRSYYTVWLITYRSRYQCRWRKRIPWYHLKISYAHVSFILAGHLWESWWMLNE